MPPLMRPFHLPNRVLVHHGPTSDNCMVSCEPTSENRVVIPALCAKTGDPGQTETVPLAAISMVTTVDASICAVIGRKYGSPELAIAEDAPPGSEACEPFVILRQREADMADVAVA